MPYHWVLSSVWKSSVNIDHTSVFAKNKCFFLYHKRAPFFFVKIAAVVQWHMVVVLLCAVELTPQPHESEPAAYVDIYITTNHTVKKHYYWYSYEIGLQWSPVSHQYCGLQDLVLPTPNAA